MTEVIESTHALQMDTSVPDLSVQELMDCSYGYEDLEACNGGDMCNALRWMTLVSFRNRGSCVLTLMRHVYRLNSEVKVVR